MTAFLIYSIAFWIYCTLFFCAVHKPLFGLYNRHCCPENIRPADIISVYRHGFVSDAIVASYLSALPLIIGVTHTMLPVFDITPAITVYNTAAAIAMGLLILSDIILYGFWNSKIDASVFTYLRSPKGAFASVSALYLITAFTAVFAIAALFFAGAQYISHVYARHALSAWMPWWGYAVTLFLFALAAAALFAIIRGLKIRPNNPSVVYYSKVPFFNHWALNPGYNIIYSLSTKDEFKDKFRHFTPQRCDEIFTPLFPTSGKPLTQLFSTPRPNILLIIWESLGAEFTGVLGGKPQITPQIDRLASESILFTRCTAGSFRTDRGLVCLLSGYPGQPTTSVIRYTRKLPNLPALPRKLRQEGYETTAVHGGDLSIMHKSDYYLASGHDRLVSQHDFPKSAPECKWGVHDGVVFDWLLDDIADKTRRGVRWFTTFQTLSSHEPFTVPYSRLANKVENSFAYTDACLGHFVDELKKTPAWHDTLIICVADHGFNISHHPQDRSAYAHIPLMLTGGAVKAPQKIDTLISQSDLAATLLGQMGLPHSEFIFSRDVLADTYAHPFSFHTYNNGFMLTDERGVTDFDNVAGHATKGPDERRELQGKAILQKLYEDLSNR